MTHHTEPLFASYIFPLPCATGTPWGDIHTRTHIYLFLAKPELSLKLPKASTPFQKVQSLFQRITHILKHNLSNSVTDPTPSYAISFLHRACVKETQQSFLKPGKMLRLLLSGH